MEHFEDSEITQFYIRLDNLLFSRGLTINSLSQHTSIGRNVIYRRRNAHKLPTIKTLIELSDFLQVTIDYLLYGEECIKKIANTLVNSKEFMKSLVIIVEKQLPLVLNTLGNIQE